MSVRTFVAALVLSLVALGGVVASPAHAASVSGCDGAQTVNANGNPGPAGVVLTSGYTLAGVCVDGVVGTGFTYAEACSIYTGCGSSGGLNLYTPSSSVIVAGWSVLYTYCLLHGQVGGVAVYTAGQVVAVTCLP